VVTSWMFIAGAHHRTKAKAVAASLRATASRA
jgi:hypothetical protein